MSQIKSTFCASMRAEVNSPAFTGKARRAVPACDPSVGGQRQTESHSTAKRASFWFSERPFSKQ